MTIVLVTGGNRGIGFGICQLAASRLPKATVIVGCRSLEAGREATDKLRQLDTQAVLDVVKLDIEDDASIADAVKAVEQKYGKLDGRYKQSRRKTPSFS